MKSIVFKMNDKQRNALGMLAVGAFGTAAVGLVAGCVPFILPALRKICLPYVPATDKQVQNVMKFLRRRNGNVIDLGSGDGRIVLSAAKLGFPAFGVELNPWLLFYSQIKASYLGLSGRAIFIRKDIWKTDLRDFDNIIIFGVEEMMPLLQEKLSKELKENGCVIACRYPLPNWPISSYVDKGIDRVWVYERKFLST